MGQKLANFTRSKLGGFIYYGAVLTVPIAIPGGAYLSLTPDFDKSSTVESQQAVEAYSNENDDILSLASTIRALQEASIQQDSPEKVIAFQNQKSTMEDQLKEQLEDFAVRVLTDETLTEADYDKVEDIFQMDVSQYSDLNLPNTPRVLYEARAEAKQDNPNGTPKEIAYAMRDTMMSNGPLSILVPVLLLLSTIGGGVFSASHTFGGGAKRTREKLASRLEKIKKRGQTPH